MTKAIIEGAPLASELLDHAASLLEEWGLARFTFMNAKGEMCEEGALRAASGMDRHVFSRKYEQWRITDGDWWDTFQPAREFLFKAGGGAAHNDAYGRTKEEAAAKLRKAADRARVDGQ